jgi:hypothetical protein
MRTKLEDALMSYPSDMSHAQKSKIQKIRKPEITKKKRTGSFTTLTNGGSSGIGGTEDIDLLSRGLNMDVTNAVVSSD